jgi:hypothetical protein
MHTDFTALTRICPAGYEKHTIPRNLTRPGARHRVLPASTRRRLRGWIFLFRRFYYFQFCEFCKFCLKCERREEHRLF